MSVPDVLNMLMDLAGSQVLKADLRPEIEVIDENDVLQEVELKIFEHHNLVKDFAKQLHDKKQQVVIFNEIIEIINKYNFSILHQYKQLWEIYIFNSLPVSGPSNKNSININEKSIELINIIKTKILNSSIKNEIDISIKTPSKIKPLMKKLLNITNEFVSIFAINVSNLTSAEAIKFKKVEDNSKIYITYLDKYLETLDLNENEDLLVSNYYNNVKMLPDPALRNNYYNQIILKVLTELKKSETELEKLNKRFAQKNDQIRKVELDIIRIKNILVQFYLYLKNHEKVKTINPIITDYISSSPINWTSYQIENLSTNLIPHWNFKEDKFRLEPIQNEALMNIDLKKNILLSAPTSWGKTLLSTYGIFNNNTIIYVVPTKPTAQQLAGMIASTQLEREKLAGTIRKNIRLEIELLSYKRFASEDNIIVATPKELYNMIKKQDIPSKIDYVILDEFHNIAYNNGEYYEYILNYAGFNKIPTMCLSATIPNFDEVSAMLKSVLHGDIHEINEHRRFYNVKRYGIYNKDMKLLNPLEWLTKDSIRSPLTHYIGLEPKVALDFYKKIPDLTPINETAQKFVSLDDIHKMECEGFKKLKELSDEQLDTVVNNKQVELDLLTDYELYLVLKKCNMSMKPMLVFNFNSKKCMERFNTQIKLMKDRSYLIYANYNDDQAIIRKYFDQIEAFEKQLATKESKSKKESTSNEEAYESRDEAIYNHKLKLYDVIISELKKFYEEYLYQNIVDEKIMEETIKLFNIKINIFNTKYGSNLTYETIMKLRKIFVEEQLNKYSSPERLSYRNKYAIHQECRLTLIEIDPENMRKIKRKINRELLREKSINGNLSSVSESFEINIDPDLQLEEKEPIVPEELNLISYDHPFMLGMEYGLLCMTELMNPALQRIAQQLILKYPFITFADKILKEGVNYPIKAVMLLGGLKGEELEEVDNTSAHQAMGRAGRRGLDMVGVVIYCGVIVNNILVQRYKRITKNDPPLMDKLLNGDSDEFIKFVKTGERPVPKVVIKPVEVLKQPAITIEVVTQSKVEEIDVSNMTWEEYCELNP
jgi:hypothetical protein